MKLINYKRLAVMTISLNSPSYLNYLLNMCLVLFSLMIFEKRTGFFVTQWTKYLSKESFLDLINRNTEATYSGFYAYTCTYYTQICVWSNMSISNRPLQPPAHSSSINLLIIIIIILDDSDHHTRSRGIARERERERHTQISPPFEYIYIYLYTE